jgi:hypothetical protein
MLTARRGLPQALKPKRSHQNNTPDFNISFCTDHLQYGSVLLFTVALGNERRVSYLFLDPILYISFLKDLRVSNLIIHSLGE